MSSPAPTSPALPRLRWWILFLLFSAIAINFLDRQVLSIVAPILRERFGFSDTDYSLILVCFLAGMTLGQVPVGMMLDRYGARRGLPLLVAGWSIVGVLHSAARSVVQFSFLRFLLGINECGSFSAGIKVIGEWFPGKERAFATGLFNSGCLAGAVLAPPVIVALINAWGWRAGFLIPGVVGCIWVIPWLKIYWEPGIHPRLSPPQKTAVATATAPEALDRTTVTQPRLRYLLGLGPVWGVILMRAFLGPVSHFYWYWLPEYLKHERGMSLTAIGLVAWMPFFCGGIGNIAGGWLSSWLVARGQRSIAARKTVFTWSALLCLLAMLVPFVGSAAAAITLICIAAFGVNAMSANHMAVLTDVFPRSMLARVSGITGVGDGLMSMCVMLFTGIMVDHFSYLPVFAAVGLLPVLAVVALRALIPSSPDGPSGPAASEAAATPIFSH